MKVCLGEAIGASVVMELLTCGTKILQNLVNNEVLEEK